MKKSVTSLLLVLIASLLSSTIAFSDTIRLKDGSVLKGKVVVFNQKTFTIVVYVGGSASQHNINADEIDSIEFDSPSGSSSQASRIEKQNSSDSGLVKVENDTPISDTVSNSSPRPTENIREKPGALESLDKPEMPSNDANNANSDDNRPLEPIDRSTSKNTAFVGDRSVSVASAADWTSTEIRVQKGQRIYINASGEVELGNNVITTPEGIEISDYRKLIPNKPTGSLIAVIGNDNDDFIHVGNSTEFIASRSGVLFLSVNEGNLKDNGGSFAAKIRVK